MESLPILLVAGVAAGLLTGLFGIGGGLVIVPVLALVLAWQDLAGDAVMQMALGTSLAVIALTSILAARAHHVRGGVRWPLLWGMAPGLMCGALLGALAAHWLPGAVLARIVGLGALAVAAVMWFKAEPRALSTVPGAWGMGIAGAVIGGISSLIGIGGGTIVVPFLRLCGLGMRQAAGCSAAATVPTAWAGALGFAIVGWTQPGLPAGHLGYVWLPGLAMIAATSLLAAPLGARLAHRLPPHLLQRAFALVPLGVGLVMLLSPP